MLPNGFWNGGPASLATELGTWGQTSLKVVQFNEPYEPRCPAPSC